MKLTRRQALAGLGAAGLAGGAVFGSGAFTQTEVSRDYGLAIVPDADGQLGLEPTGHTEAVTGGDSAIEIDIQDINSQGDTVFGDIEGTASEGDPEGALTLTNNNQSGEPIWVYVPRALNVGDDGTLSGVTDTQQESVEFLVQDPDADVLLDISMPPEYPDVTEAFDGANTDNPDNASGSTIGKVENTGAVLLAPGESLDVEIRVLVAGPRAEPDEFEKVYRFAAQRDAPDDESAWDETGALEGQHVDDVL